MDEFLRFLTSEMEEPGVISWFHFFALIPIIALSILIPLFFRNSSEKVYKRILLIFWIVLMVLEVIKQIVKAYHYGDPPYWEISIRDFPFSICSMVYYFIPIILFVDKEKHPKIVDAAVGYLAFITFAGGLAVCIYTKMATSRLVYINYQTFIHHGSQVILGVFIYVWNRKNITIKTVYRSLIAFVITAIIAIGINLAFYPHFINMFFINPTRITNLVIGNVIQEKAGYPVYLLVFLTVVGAAVFLVYFIESSIYRATQKKKA